MACDPNCKAQDLVLRPSSHRRHLCVLELLWESATLFFLLLYLLTSNFLVEIVGYAARAVSNRQLPNPTLGPYVIQTLLLLVAPPLLAATIYMILGTIIVGVDGEPYSLVKRKWLAKIFVTCDVISFFIQLGGEFLNKST